MNKKILSLILGRIHRLAMSWYNAQLKPYNLRGCDLPFLLALAKKASNQNELNCLLSVDKSNITRRLTTLEQLGYVQRSHGKDKPVQLTPKALELLPSLEEMINQWWDLLFGDWDEDQRQQFRQALETMLERAQQATNELEQPQNQ